MVVCEGTIGHKGMIRCEGMIRREGTNGREGTIGHEWTIGRDGIGDQTIGTSLCQSPSFTLLIIVKLLKLL